jgi:hypothetical protein
LLVGVKFFGVPLEYWTPNGLSYVASAVGRPLDTDALTATKNKISFARVCVEIDASFDFVDEFDLQCDNGNKPILLFSNIPPQTQGGNL